MAKRSASPAAPRSSRRKAAPLGPGLHPATVESIVALTDTARPVGDAARPSYRLRLADGREIVASPLPQVSPSFVDQCLREGRTVIVMDTPGGVAIAGALQTAEAPAPDAQGRLVLEARHLRLRAGETLEIEAPGASLRLEPGGAVRLEGDRMVIDMAALVRIFSGKVEIP